MRGGGHLGASGIARAGICLLLVAAGGAAAGSEGDEILAHQPPELVERLYRQKVLVLEELQPRERDGDDFFLAYVLFAAPPQAAYALLAESERHIEFRPEMETIHRIAGGDDGHVDEHRIRVMFLNVRYRLRYRMDPARRAIHWGLDESFPNGLVRADGFWEFYELEPGLTLGRFGAVVDVGPALPRRFQQWVTSRNLPRTLDRARRWVDSGGSYRP